MANNLRDIFIRITRTSDPVIQAHYEETIVSKRKRQAITPEVAAALLKPPPPPPNINDDVDMSDNDDVDMSNNDDTEDIVSSQLEFDKNGATGGW